MFIPFLFLFFVLISPCFSQGILGQVLQISTAFSKVYGKPTWLLIIREQETGLVMPHLYEIKNNDNYWLAFTAGRTYRITASILKFGTFAKIDNLCHLQDGIIDGNSMIIRLTGVLSPDPASFDCQVISYPETILPVAP